MARGIMAYLFVVGRECQSSLVSPGRSQRLSQRRRMERQKCKNPMEGKIKPEAAIGSRILVFHLVLLMPKACFGERALGGNFWQERT